MAIIAPSYSTCESGSSTHHARKEHIQPEISACVSLLLNHSNHPKKRPKRVRKGCVPASHRVNVHAIRMSM